jgi:hypothetical protein
VEGRCELPQDAVNIGSVRRGIVVGCAVVSLLTVSGALLTQAGAAPSATCERPRARDLYRRGEEAFGREDYGSAVAAFRSAYDLCPEPTVLFTIAVCERRRGRRAAAIDAMSRYLEDAGDAAAPDRIREAQQFLAELRGVDGVEEPDAADGAAAERTSAPDAEVDRTPAGDQCADEESDGSHDRGRPVHVLSPAAAPSWLHDPVDPGFRYWPPSPETEEGCSRCNGEWRTQGFAAVRSCVCRTEDAGRSCWSSEECQYLCAVPWEVAVGLGNVQCPIDSPCPEIPEGHCAEFITPFGCRGWIQIDDGPDGPFRHVVYICTD